MVSACSMDWPTAGTRSSGRRCASARSSSTRSAGSTSCRSGEPTNRTEAATGCSGARIRCCSATPSGRTRGSATSSLRTSSCGGCRTRCAGRAYRARSGTPGRAAVCVHWCPLMRPARDGDPGARDRPDVAATVRRRGAVADAPSSVTASRWLFCWSIHSRQSRVPKAAPVGASSKPGK